VSAARELPPHFADPHADKIAILEARCVELDEQLADAHKEAKAWQAQLESALARLDVLEGRGLPPTSSNIGHG
jgi:hypothetical protein